MPLPPGARLGPYEIVAPIGAGGMGEVYRAHDGRLQRMVALKLLRTDVFGDLDRLRRFEQEARAAAALNHPNVLAVFDVGSDGGAPYLVSELLEGETLRQRLERGALAPRRAAEIAVQIARGLAAAHDKGIVHRDLKPENLFLTRDGRVKILDFGVAKLRGVAEPGANLATSPLAADLTAVGTVIGTASYMSPEQAQGSRDADARSDLFSFGSILYEMLAGQRAFQGGSPRETLRAVTHEEPAALAPSSLSPGIDGLVRHCLEKAPEERFQSARDLAFHLEALLGSVTAPTRGLGTPGAAGARRRAQLAAIGVAGALAGAAMAGLALRLFAPPPDVPEVRHLTFSGTDSLPAASPDGRSVAFSSSRDGVSRIWLKERVRGNEAALTSGPGDFAPRFSPDGSLLLFARDEGGQTSLYRMAVLGGEARQLVADARAGDWSPDGRRIAFLRLRAGPEGPVAALGVAAAEGGDEREIAVLDDPFYGLLRFAPDGRTIALVHGGSGVRGEIWLVDSTSGERRRVPTGADGRIYGLAWIRGGGFVVAQATTVSGGSRNTPARILLCSVAGRCRAVHAVPEIGPGLDILAPGELVYGTESASQNLFEAALVAGAPNVGWRTRGSASDRQPTYSPDGRWVAFSSDRSGNLDIWALETGSGALRRITDDPGEDWDPAWTEGGRRLLFSSNRSGRFELWRANADGSSPQQITSAGADYQNPTASPDGTWIAFVSYDPPSSGLWRVRADGSGAQRLVSGDLRHPEVSPDGLHAAFHRAVPGHGEEIRVVRLADGELLPFAIQLASAPGVGRCRWLPDGRGLAFLGTDESGRRGVYAQDFAPDLDTAATRRRLAGFAAGLEPETFGIVPDASRILLAVEQPGYNLAIATGVSGVEPPR